MNTKKEEKKFFINSNLVKKELDQIINQYTHLLVDGEVTKTELKELEKLVKHLDAYIEIEWSILYLRLDVDLQRPVYISYKKRYNEVKRTLTSITAFIKQCKEDEYNE